jgi:hypothetical protein
VQVSIVAAAHDGIWFRKYAPLLQGEVDAGRLESLSSPPWYTSTSMGAATCRCCRTLARPCPEALRRTTGFIASIAFSVQLNAGMGAEAAGCSRVRC